MDVACVGGRGGVKKGNFLLLRLHLLDTLQQVPSFHFDDVFFLPFFSYISFVLSAGLSWLCEKDLWYHEICDPVQYFSACNLQDIVKPL